MGDFINDVGVGRPAHCGRRHSLAGILNCVGWGRELSMHHSLLPDCRSDVSSCSELLKPVFPTMVSYALELLPEINLFSLILLLRHFTTATGKETKTHIVLS